MVKKILLLLLAIFLSACWTGAVEVTGVYTKTLMNGHVDYYVRVVGDDLEVTEGVYNEVKLSLENSPSGKLTCDFEKLCGLPHYDDVVYCKVKDD